MNALYKMARDIKQWVPRGHHGRQIEIGKFAVSTFRDRLDAMKFGLCGFQHNFQRLSFDTEITKEKIKTLYESRADTMENLIRYEREIPKQRLPNIWDGIILGYFFGALVTGLLVKFCFKWIL